MSKKALGLSKTLHQYLLDNSLNEHPILKKLRIFTTQDKKSMWQILPEEGQLISVLIKIIQAKKTLEIGTYTGYSTLITALALPKDGKIFTCDISNQWQKTARYYWKMAGVDKKITQFIAPAQETLVSLCVSGHKKTFDFIFIDADKKNYDVYYEQSLRLIRSGGVILIDNVLWQGRVADSHNTDVDTKAIRTLNAKIHTDSRVESAMVPIADGLSIVWKK